eukprot:10102972-Karenia_brevis.AAC.1
MESLVASCQYGVEVLRSAKQLPIIHVPTLSKLDAMLPQKVSRASRICLPNGREALSGPSGSPWPAPLSER